MGILGYIRLSMVWFLMELVIVFKFKSTYRAFVFREE